MMNVRGIVWMGVRTEEYGPLRRLFGDVMGMAETRRGDGFTWYGLPGGEEIQVYGPDDIDHTFFGEGPTIGFLVEDVGRAVAELQAAGVDLIGPGDTDGTNRWQHFFGPDGNVYEVIGPATS